MSPRNASIQVTPLWTMPPTPFSAPMASGVAPVITSTGGTHTDSPDISMGYAK